MECILRQKDKKTSLYVLLLVLFAKKYRLYCKLFQEVNVLNLEQFSWSKTLNDFRCSCLLLFNVSRGTVTTKANEETLVKGKYVNLKTHIGTTTA